MALLAWETDALNAGHSLRIPHLADHFIDVALKRFNRREARDIKRNNYLTRIRRRLVVFVEVNHVATKCGAVQRAGKQTEDEREAIAFVTADRKQEAFFSSSRVSQRFAERVDHPTFRHQLASLSFGLHLAVRRHASGDIQNDRRFLESRNRE